MTRLLFGAAAIALLATNPAAAQLLGGSGGSALGGSLNSSLGGMGGGLGGMGSGSLGGTLDRSTTDTAMRSTRSTRVDKSIDRRSGKVSASGRHSGDTSIANGSTLAGRAIGGDAALAGSGSGSADAQLVGTDAVRSAGQQTIGTARSTTQSARTTAQGVPDMASSAVSNAGSYAGSATANGTAMGGGSASGGGGMLALAGSSAANGSGSFGVTPGMTVSDVKGRAIGTVREVRTAADGAVRDVVMQVGNRTATLPAANFSGSGSVLVSAMSQGDVKDAAKDQSKDEPAR